MNSPRDAYQEVINRLPAFARAVQPYYELLKWEWVFTGIPKEEDICRGAEEVLYHALSSIEEGGEESSCVVSGGLQARFYKNYKDEWVAIVEFVIGDTKYPPRELYEL